MLTFLALAFGISWLGGFAWIMAVSDWVSGQGFFVRAYVPNVAVVVGPALAAIAVTRRAEGRSGVTTLLSRLRPNAAHWRWYVGMPLGALLATGCAYHWAGTSWLALVGAVSASGGLLFAAHLAIQLVVVGFGEELGWRGWLLPRLARTRTLGVATILTAIIWEAWHLPKFVSNPATALTLVLLLAAASVLLSLLWRQLNGNVFGLALAHASMNAPVVFAEHVLPITPTQFGRGAQNLSLLYVTVAILCAVRWHRKWTNDA